jgi:hypothetical protein
MLDLCAARSAAARQLLASASGLRKPTPYAAAPTPAVIALPSADCPMAFQLKPSCTRRRGVAVAKICWQSG